MSEKRLSLTEHGQVRYSLKNPWCDGTTHVIFKPLDFIARLAGIEDPDVIRKILVHVDRNTPTTTSSPLPEPRAPPPAGLFDTP